MKNKTQLIRHIIQFVSFLVYPSLFIVTWNNIGTIYKLLISGKFSQIISPLVTVVIVFLVTLLWGRFFCSFVCSFGAMQEFFNKLGDILKIKKIKIDNDKYFKYIKYFIIFISIIFWSFDSSISFYSPWNAFGGLIGFNFAYLISFGGIILLVIVILSLFIDRFFCRYLCPLGGILSLISIPRIFRIKKSKKCINCNLCNKVCPMNVNDIDSGDCINCFKCIKACPKKALSTTSDEAISGSVAALSILGLSYVGNIITTEEVHTYTSESIGVYKDGTYNGKADGYKGEVSVIVDVKNGNITGITIDSYKDDEQFFSKAKSGVINQIFDKQSVDVKVVSGATYSSRGIINAVANALGMDNVIHIEDTNNDDSNNENIVTDDVVDSNVESEEVNKIFDFLDGAYNGVGKGRNGDIEVSVVIIDGKITDVSIVSSQEDASYFNKAKGVISSVISNQSINVSKVSGATMSSNGILEAIANALDLEFTNTNSER